MSNSRVDITEIKEFFHIKKGINDFVYYRYKKGNFTNSNFPIRINGFATGICLKGWMDIDIGLHKVRICKDELIIILPCYIIQVHDISDDFDFESVIVTNDFMDAININADKLINPYIYLEENPIVKINTTKGKGLIKTIFESIHKLCSFSDLPYYREIEQHYVYALLFAIGYIFEQFSPSKKNSFSKNSLLKRFFSLIQIHFKKEHSVKFYADELCLTPKYLSHFIKKTSGKTASDWIREILILEAKVLLHRNQLSIKQVADELNFPDNFSFSKFFKKNTGISPKEYKNTTWR